MSSPQESWHSKLKERLEGGNTRPAVRAIQELTPTTDPDAIRTLMEALSYRDQDVRENAAWALSLSAERHAAGALWAEAAEVLQAAAEGARDNEERRNMERAAATIEACLRNPG